MTSNGFRVTGAAVLVGVALLVPHADVRQHSHPGVCNRQLVCKGQILVWLL